MIPKILRQISYGLYLVSARRDRSLNAQIANTVMQLSNDPPLLGLSIHRDNLTHRFIVESGDALVMVLDQETPLSLIQRFGFHSGRDTQKFDRLDYELTERGLPVLHDYVLGYVELEITQQVDCGSHTLFVGEIVAGKTLRSGEALTYRHYHEVKRGAVSAAAPVSQGARSEGCDHFICGLCGYVFDPVMGDAPSGVSPGTKFADLPVSWICPLCGAGQDQFEGGS